MSGVEDPLAPARGCMVGMVLALGIWAVLATVAVVIVVLT